jgi:hypothetical protein
MDEGLDNVVSINRLVGKAVAAERERKRKRLRREAMEAERLARLDRLRQLTASARTSPRWMMVSGRWSWHEYSAERGAFVDTGIEPAPGVPIAQQRPPGR